MCARQRLLHTSLVVDRLWLGFRLRVELSVDLPMIDDKRPVPGRHLGFSSEAFEGVLVPKGSPSGTSSSSPSGTTSISDCCSSPTFTVKNTNISTTHHILRAHKARRVTISNSFKFGRAQRWSFSNQQTEYSSYCAFTKRKINTNRCVALIKSI